MRVAILIGLTALLVACGADGEPVQPTAQANVHITPNGVALGTNLQVGQGPMSVNVGVTL